MTSGASLKRKKKKEREQSKTTMTSSIGMGTFPVWRNGTSKPSSCWQIVNISRVEQKRGKRKFSSIVNVTTLATRRDFEILRAAKQDEKNANAKRISRYTMEQHGLFLKGSGPAVRRVYLR